MRSHTLADIKIMKRPPRVAWGDFPPAVLLASESQTKQHPKYHDAKTGDATAAANLVIDLVDDAGVEAVKTLVLYSSESGKPLLACVNAYEQGGYNAIPAALAKFLSQCAAISFDSQVTQTNIVSHTGADGYGRLARQAAFGGDVQKDSEYVMVDDFVGQGGTLANLRGWIEKQGGKVIGAVALTGKPYSAKLTPSHEQLNELRQRHGSDFEKWWRDHFGHAFGCLTQSEARYLARSPDVETIRDRLAAAVRGRGRPGYRRSSREHKT